MSSSDAKFNPFGKGAMHRRHERRWRLETFVAEATLDELEAGAWLGRFSNKENPEDYGYRKSMSVPLDMCRDGVRIRIDNLWRVPPKRTVAGPANRYHDLIRRLIHDADGEGTTLNEFMRRAAWNHYVTGCDIVPQVASAPAGATVRTKADQQRYGIGPYFMQFTPLERYDWAVNGARNFIWARYCLGDEPREDELAEQPETATWFLTLTSRGWRKHRAVRSETGELVGVETFAEEDTPHGQRRPNRPLIIKFYFAESQKIGQGGVPLSLLTRPAVVAKVALNLKSQADADLLAAVTRWLLTGVSAEDLPDTYGPGVVWKVADPASNLLVVQGDVNHVAEKRNWLVLYLMEILRLLKFRGGMGDVTGSPASGVKLAIERTDLDNELRATASQLETVEMEMMRQAVMLATGDDIPATEAAERLGYSVQYNRDYILEPVGEMLDNIRTWVRGCGFLADELTEITREMTRQLTNMLLRDGTAGHGRAMEQIDSADLGAVARETGS